MKIASGFSVWLSSILLAKQLWKESSRSNNTSTKPWLIIRDLNELTSSSQEKSANNKGNSTKYTNSKKVFDENELIGCYKLSFT